MREFIWENKSKNSQRHIVVFFLVFFIDSLNFLNILAMHLINLVFTWLLVLLVLPAFQPFPHHCNEPYCWRVEEQSSRVEENDSRHFNFVEQHSIFKEVIESPKSFMFIQDNCWIDCVIVFESVFDKAFPTFNEYSHLMRSRQSGLLETSWQQTNILSVCH